MERLDAQKWSLWKPNSRYFVQHTVWLCTVAGADVLWTVHTSSVTGLQNQEKPQEVTFKYEDTLRIDTRDKIWPYNSIIT